MTNFRSWARTTRETLPGMSFGNGRLVQIAPLYGHERDVTTLAMSPDGRTLASGDVIGIVRLWDLRTGSAVAVLRGHALSISRLVFSADGSLLASAADMRQPSQSEVLRVGRRPRAVSWPGSTDSPIVARRYPSS